MPEPTAIAWQETPLVLIAGDVDDDPEIPEDEALEDDEDDDYEVEDDEDLGDDPDPNDEDEDDA